MFILARTHRTHRTPAAAALPMDCPVASVSGTARRLRRVDGSADITVWLPRFRRYFSCPAVGCSADAQLSHPDKRWLRRHGCAVNVASPRQLAGVLAAGIEPGRVVLYHDGMPVSAIRAAVAAGVRHHVVGADSQIAVLAEHGHRRHQATIDIAAPCISDLVASMGEHRLVEPVGLYAELPGGQTPASAVADMLGAMAEIRTASGVMLSRISLAGNTLSVCSPAGELQALHAEIEDAVEDGCARFRLPRPVVVVNPT